jgi:hypothetical protein
VSIYSFLRNNSFLPLAAGLICLLNFLLTIGFYLFLANSVFPQGINLMTAYTIPFWQRILPFLGSLSLILTIILLIVFFIKRQEVKSWQMLIALFAAAFIPWLFYWNLVGLSY